MTKKFLKSILVIALIISSMSMFSGCGKKENEGNNQQKQEVSKDVYEAPLKSYMDGLKNKDLNKICQAYPEFMRAPTQTDIDAMYAMYEARFGSNVKLEYTLGDAVKVEEQRDLDILATQIKELYPDAGDINITAAYIITVNLSVSGDGVVEGEAAENPSANSENDDIKKSDSQDFYVYEYNGNWYMF